MLLMLFGTCLNFTDPLVEIKMRRQNCFVCHKSLPRAILHFQHIPAGYRGRGASAKVLMCRECHASQEEANAKANEHAIIAVVILLAFSFIGFLIKIFVN